MDFIEIGHQAHGEPPGSPIDPEPYTYATTTRPPFLKALLGRVYGRVKKEAHRPEKRGQSDPVIPERTANRLARLTVAGETP